MRTRFERRFRDGEAPYVIALLAVALLRGAALSAQGGPSALPATVTLDEVLRLLEERSPRTAAERAAIPVAAAERITAQTLPNPTVSYGGAFLVSGLSTGATTQHQMVAEQPLLMFHQRPARLDAADKRQSRGSPCGGGAGGAASRACDGCLRHC